MFFRLRMYARVQVFVRMYASDSPLRSALLEQGLRCLLCSMRQLTHSLGAHAVCTAICQAWSAKAAGLHPDLDSAAAASSAVRELRDRR